MSEELKPDPLSEEDKQILREAPIPFEPMGIPEGTPSPKARAKAKVTEGPNGPTLVVS